MGPSQSADFTSTLNFVQNLNDDNFGQVEIYRNDEGKFIMKCAKSFLTGDKRHSDFRKVLEFIKTTNNKNVVGLFHLEQYHESNVCIEYQKVFVYTEYLNFTLKGLIVNKKNIDEQEVWYLIKSMVELMIELEHNDIRMVFSLQNIFLTLKGIPSVFLYHFICNQKPLLINDLPNIQNGQSGYPRVQVNSINSHIEEQSFAECPSEYAQKQLCFKPESMSYSLGKTVIQLLNMQLIQPALHQTEQQSLKNQLFMVNKKNRFLGKILKLLLISSPPSQILNSIHQIHHNKQITISSQIRFNKFRYVVADQQKAQPTIKDLNLKDFTMNDKHLNDFQSRPLSAANTPIYRLKQSEPKQGSREFSVKNKLMKPQQNFFKNKKNKPLLNDNLNTNPGNIDPKQEQNVTAKILQMKKTKENQDSLSENEIQDSSSKKQIQDSSVENEIKEGGERRKANSLSGQTSNVRNLGVGRNSKLSLISKRNLSTSKIQHSHPIYETQNTNESCKSIDNQNNLTESNKRDQENSPNDQQEQTIESGLQTIESGLKGSEQLGNKASVRTTNRIKEILNEQLSKSRQQYKNYTYKLKNSNNNKSSLLYKNPSQDSSYLQSKPINNNNNKAIPNKTFFKPEKEIKSETSSSVLSKLYEKSKPQFLLLNTKTQQQEEQQKSIMYKPFMTEHNDYHDNCQVKQQSIKALFGLLQHQTHNNQPIHSKDTNPTYSNKSDNKDSKESMSSSVCMNGLDKSNFLSTLQMKKSINNLKVKNISHKKDLILSNLNKNYQSFQKNSSTTLKENQLELLSELSHQQTKNQQKTCLKKYLTQKQSQKNSLKESQIWTLKNSANPTSRVTGLVEISINGMREQENISGFEKKKVKLRSNNNIMNDDRHKQLQSKQLFRNESIKNSNEQNLKINKENYPFNIDDQIGNSSSNSSNNNKMRRLSLRSKALPN